MEVTRVMLLMSMVIVGTVYCTTFGDGSVYGEFNVHCDDTRLVVFFNKTALDERTVTGYNNRSYVLKWDGSSNALCVNDGSKNVGTSSGSLSSNGAYATTLYMESLFTTGQEKCNVNIYSDNDYIYYNNTITITYGENPNNNIGREEYDKYHVTCFRNRTVEEKLTGDKFDVKSRVDGEDTKNNTADFSFSLTHEDMTGTAQSSYKLGDYIKFKMTFNTVDTATKAVLQTCYATSDGTQNKYNLISNRCDTEVETTITSASDKETVFNTEAFRFLPSGNSVYVECLVRVCLDSNATPECSFCSKKRRRRAITDGSNAPAPLIDSQTATIRSPIFYIIDKEPAQPANQANQQQQASVLSGTNGLIVIVLLSAFVFVICAAVIKKVFFTAPQVTVDAPVVAYHNKAMA